MSKLDKEKLDQTIFDLTKKDTDENPNQNFAETIKAWLDDAFIHSKTRLNANQVIVLTILKTLSDKYKVKCISKLITNFVRYKLSEGGQSSKELVEILKNRPELGNDDELMKAIEPFLK